ESTTRSSCEVSNDHHRVRWGNLPVPPNPLHWSAGADRAPCPPWRGGGVKGIVGRKLGMTQVFDEETGQVTSLTVIEAGPCPVVSVKQAAVDGYDAVQVAYGEVAEHRLSKPKLGHLKKNNVAPHRHLLELRGLTGATEGESVTV